MSDRGRRVGNLGWARGRPLWPVCGGSSSAGGTGRALCTGLAGTWSGAQAGAMPAQRRRQYFHIGACTSWRSGRKPLPHWSPYGLALRRRAKSAGWVWVAVVVAVWTRTALRRRASPSVGWVGSGGGGVDLDSGDSSSCSGDEAEGRGGGERRRGEAALLAAAPPPCRHGRPRPGRTPTHLSRPRAADSRAAGVRVGGRPLWRAAARPPLPKGRSGSMHG